jgi:UDP-N-acetylglucosamine--N-acetylmuramyl-(pentapeptide) pyrophosphoryl-undecaprenol N-acetylglucosamine transferase
LKRVYFGIFGSGLGHASRMMAVSQRLVNEGCKVMFSSSSEATGYIRKHGFACNDIPLVDVVFTETGNFSATHTMKVAPWLILKVFQQAGMEARNIIRFRPDVVLSDSQISTVMASKILGLNSVTVLNQLKLVSSPKTPPILAKLLSSGSISVGNEFWELSDRILFPDLPPPFTISDRNLWGAGSAGARAEYIGFLTPPRSDFVDAETSKIMQSPRKMIFWQVSGPPKTRTTVLPKVMKVASLLKDDYLSIISAGDPMGTNAPRPFEGGFVYDWCPSKDALLDRCDVFVSRAGHVTISELILRGKASILVPIQAQMEQMGNAAKAEKLGVAVDLPEERLTEGYFRDALSRLEAQKTTKKAAELKEYASGFDAIGSIVSALGN